MRPVSMRDTFDADQPSRAATSLPCQPPAVRSVRSSAASRRSRTDGASTMGAVSEPACKIAIGLVTTLTRAPPCPCRNRTREDAMTAPQTHAPRSAPVDPVAAAWLAGGVQRAVDALLVSRVERRRIALVDGNVVDRGLTRTDPLDGVVRSEERR